MNRRVSKPAAEVEPGRHTITKDYIRQRLDWLRFKDGRHERVFVFFDTLLGEGCDPFLLDAWLDGIDDGVIVVGMPGDLVLDYWGQPVFTDEIVFDGAPARSGAFDSGQVGSRRKPWPTARSSASTAKSSRRMAKASPAVRFGRTVQQ